MPSHRKTMRSQLVNRSRQTTLCLKVNIACGCVFEVQPMDSFSECLKCIKYCHKGDYYIAKSYQNMEESHGKIHVMCQLPN